MSTTTEKTVVQGILRNDWGYQGLLISDDLNMCAVYRLGIGNSAVAALEAGVDLLLISYDSDLYYRAMHSAAEAFRRGLLRGPELVAHGVARVSSRGHPRGLRSLRSRGQVFTFSIPRA
ncbi:glycoside hydrolase family 3 N-terminal domain-containing protein [Candidatus Accumulibacter meliphilus]|jgi:beta-N-acetylhexosaminidase|uniref:glycoside hydrolase family 3 N-terminal domain-containing protein n=1 Tax=Candidatus Accumulibacter meliphilus TaxID=2211374 RepID=UPI003DA9A929